jgi:hypothetical protein
MTNRTNEFTFLNSLDLDSSVSKRLSHQLSKIVSGSDEIYTTPLGKDNDPDKILSEWDKIFDAHMNKFPEELIALEKSNRSKFGPRSIAVPWEDRKQLVRNYFGSGDEYSLTSANPASDLRLRPLSLKNASLYLKNNTNSGLPFYIKKKHVKAEVLANFDRLLERQDPCIMFTRTQESKKTRAVWGFPIADTLNEMRFYRPVLDTQKRQTWRAAIVGPTTVDEYITKLIRNAQSENQSLVSIDFSSYDATLRKSLQLQSFHYIKKMFQPQYWDEIDYIAERFRTIGLLTPDGVWDGDHGVPSGSTFTNEVDSIAQFLCAETLDMNLLDYQIQGDDGAYRTDDPERLKDGFRQFGLEVNDEKSYVSQDYLVYLQNLHSINLAKPDGSIPGIYPTYRALNRLIYQERFDDFKEFNLEGSDFYSIRTIAILENCRNHPLFKEFVNFILKYDKYGLKPTSKGIERFIQMIIDKAGAEGIIQHQYGDQIRGIRSFETFKIIAEH